jgi:hypothetical protein
MELQFELGFGDEAEGASSPLKPPIVKPAKSRKRRERKKKREQVCVVFHRIVVA